MQHVARHGVTIEEATDALINAFHEDRSHTSGHPIRYGCTSSGRLVSVVLEWVDTGIVFPITAFEPD